MSYKIDAFISYTRADHAIASSLTKELEKLGVTVWSDFKLMPGDAWREVILEALRLTKTVLVIITEESANSDWVQEEIRTALANRSELVIPVLIGSYDLLPIELRSIQAVRVQNTNEMPEAAKSIADRLSGIRNIQPELASENLSALANNLACEAEKTGSTAIHKIDKSSAFIVHGHDEHALADLTGFLGKIGIRPIVLRDVEDAEESLLTRFFRVGGEARFAIVLFCPDDRGASRFQYDDSSVGERSLKFRARQNVILELGFFYGKLGFQNVYVLLKEPTEKWPDFELPSDISGAVFKRMDKSGNWKGLLVKAMKAQGLSVRE